YIAAPILLIIEKRWPGKDARGAKARGMPAGAPAATAPSTTGTPGPPSGGALIGSHCHPAGAAVCAPPDQASARPPPPAGQGGAAGAEGLAWGEAARRRAQGRDDLWPTAGIHPHRASEFDDDAARRLETLVAEPDVVAVGETGLDFHYDHSPRDVQRASF